MKRRNVTKSLAVFPFQKCPVTLHPCQCFKRRVVLCSAPPSLFFTLTHPFYTLEVRTRSFNLVTCSFHHMLADIFKTCIHPVCLSASHVVFTSTSRDRKIPTMFCSGEMILHGFVASVPAVKQQKHLMLFQRRGWRVAFKLLQCEAF